MKPTALAIDFVVASIIVNYSQHYVFTKGLINVRQFNPVILIATVSTGKLSDNL